MDLSKLSDADLMAYHAGDLSKVSDDGLRQISTAKAAAAPAPREPAYIDNPSLLQGVPDEQITQEMHPKVGVLERMVAKNLSNDPKATAAYLKSNHPDLEVKSQDGQTLLRAPGEEKYKVLDPDNTPLTGGAGLMGYVKHPGEALMDLGDSAYDLLSGVGQGAAAGAGAVGGAAGGPAGAIAGGMAAGGASAAGLEAIRQKLGQVAGIPQKMDGSDIVGQGVMGGVLPGLAGAGPFKGTAPAAYKYLSRELYPAWASAASGIPKSAIKTIQDRLPELMEHVKTGIMGPVTDLRDRLTDSIAKLSTESGQRVGSAIDAIQGPISIAPLKKKLDDAIVKAQQEAIELPNEVSMENIRRLQDMRDKLFTREAEQTGGGEVNATAREDIPDAVKGSALFRLQNSLGDEANLQALGQGGKMASPRMVGTRPEKQASELARGLYDDAGNLLDQASNGLSSSAKETYRDFQNIKKTLSPYFSTPQKTFDTMGNLDKTSKRQVFELLQDLEHKYDIPIMNDAKMLEAYKYFGNPAAIAQSGLGATSTGRAIPAQLFGGVAGGVIGQKLAGYPGMMIGAYGGKQVGKAAGSPAAIRATIAAQRWLEGQAGKIPAEAKYSLYPAGRSVWDAISQNQKAKEEENKP